MSWWKRLLSGTTAPNQERLPPAEKAEGYTIAPRSWTEARAEDALPGAHDVPGILELVPPPLDPALTPDLRSDRNYAPDPIATFAMEWRSVRQFRRDAFRAELPKETHASFGLPTLYARLPSNRVTFLTSGSDGEFDPNATSLIAAWDLRDGDSPVERIPQGIRAVSKWLAARPEQFEPAQLDTSKLQQQWERARAIIAVRPEYVAILEKPRQGHFDGRKVWLTLHGMGIAWGDMDQFQWADPTHQTDYLFWAEVDDGEIGYALP